MLKRSREQKRLQHWALWSLWPLLVGACIAIAQPTNTPDSSSWRRFGRLELAFETRWLRTVCESESEAAQEFGPEVAEALRHRLADLRAATSPRDLVAGRLRPLKRTDENLLVVDLNDNYRMVFCSNHPKRQSKKSGRIDWSNVSRVKILRIKIEDA